MNQVGVPSPQGKIVRNPRTPSAPAALWVSSNHRHVQISERLGNWAIELSDLGHKLLPNRLKHQTWIRYRIDLGPYNTNTEEPTVMLVPITSALIESLSRSSLRDSPQVLTAIQLWQHGLRSGYVWIKDNKAMCLQWLLSHHDNRLLSRLPYWSGMYPPLPGNWGQLENILTLPAGMRHPGGAAGPFALAMYHLAAKQGLQWLITHVHEHNTAAHRWAQRNGWTAYGRIHRYQIDLPLIRSRPLYLHDVIAPESKLPMLHAPRRSPSQPEAAGDEQ